MRRTSFSGLADEAGAATDQWRRPALDAAWVTYVWVWAEVGPKPSVLRSYMRDVLSRVSGVCRGLQNERGRYPQGALGFDEARGVAGHAASFLDIFVGTTAPRGWLHPCVCRGLPTYLQQIHSNPRQT
jgi:hypothetical protein